VLPGDVLLVTGNSSFSNALVLGQKAIYLKAKSSHVELSLGDGVFIHATDDGGVHLSLLIDEVNSCREGWRVIRHKSIVELGLETEKLQKSGMFFYAQGYNKVYMGSGTKSSSFCSELVAKVYEKSGIRIINGKAPSKVAPAHFDKEADEMIDWIDVTAEYKEILEDMTKDIFPYRLMMQTLTQVMTRRKLHEGIRESIITRLENGTEGERKAAVEYKKMLHDRELSFWYEKNR